VFSNWNTATVIGNFNGVVFMNAYNDARGVSRHRFVNGVVDDFVDKVVKAAFIG